MRASDQHVHAVGADRAHYQRTQQSHDPTGVPEGVRHRQDAGADVTFEQVHHGVEIGGRVLEIAVAERVVRRLGHHGLHVQGGGVALIVAVQKSLFFVLLHRFDR